MSRFLCFGSWAFGVVGFFGLVFFDAFFEVLFTVSPSSSTPVTPSERTTGVKHAEVITRRLTHSLISLAKPLGFSAPASHGCQAQSLARRFLHKSCDLCFCGGREFLQREGDRPHLTVVEVRRVVEAERGVPRLELGLVLEEQDGLA